MAHNVLTGDMVQVLSSSMSLISPLAALGSSIRARRIVLRKLTHTNIGLFSIPRSDAPRRLEPFSSRFCMRCCSSANRQYNCDSHLDRSGCPVVILEVYNSPDIGVSCAWWA
ncbi:hypothetical protein BS47DRAFT_1339246 [Hydnum rufescens UP504]|uniref:Uncharacterized protein n=1 Tax=Hydnum rufescens UP504 TaxID=1448309 RepID=A0A9P6E0E8_9AGAM|nr:hypothetical protein BS47DRAFT_1339246 [Hydnum rufescens UP504]